MTVALIISILLNIFLLQEARNFATKSIDKHREMMVRLRIFCEYLDLFVINNKQISKDYKTLNWSRLKALKLIIQGRLQYKSLVDNFFKEFDEEGFYELTEEQKKKLYMVAANSQPKTDEEIKIFANHLVKVINETQQAETQ